MIKPDKQVTPQRISERKFVELPLLETAQRVGLESPRLGNAPRPRRLLPDGLYPGHHGTPATRGIAAPTIRGWKTASSRR